MVNLCHNKFVYFGDAYQVKESLLLVGRLQKIVQHLLNERLPNVRLAEHETPHALLPFVPKIFEAFLESFRLRGQFTVLNTAHNHLGHARLQQILFIGELVVNFKTQKNIIITSQICPINK